MHPMLSDFRDVKSIPQYLRGPPFRGLPFRGPPIQGPPSSLWNCTISQVHQEFPSYPRSTLAQGNHRGVFQGPPRSTTISVGYNHFTGSPRISFQGPPWPKEIIKVYPRSTKVHHHPCGIQPFHRFTKNFLLIQDPPWPKETIKVYPRSTTISVEYKHFTGSPRISFLSKIHPGPRKP